LCFRGFAYKTWGKSEEFAKGEKKKRKKGPTDKSLSVLLKGGSENGANLPVPIEAEMAKSKYCAIGEKKEKKKKTPKETPPFVGTKEPKGGSYGTMHY